jgi:hypothetical protein
MNISLAYGVRYKTMIVEQVIVVRVPQFRQLWLSLGVCYSVRCHLILIRGHFDCGKAGLVDEAVSDGGHLSII